MPRYPILPPYDNSESTSRIIDLMLRQGESRAQDVAIRGGIWGSTIQNIGQGLGQAASSYFQGKELEQDEQAAVEQRAQQDAFLVNWIERAEAGEDVSPAELVPVFGPERAAKFAEAYGAAKTEPTDTAEALNQLTALSNGWTALNPEARAMMYPLFRAIGEQNPLAGPLVQEGQIQLPERYTPETAETIDLMFGSFAEKMPRRTKIVGGNLVDEDTGEPIFTDTPKAGTLEAYLVGQYGPNPTAEQQLEGRRRFEAAGRAPAGSAQAGTFAEFVAQKYPGGATADQLLEARGEWAAATREPESDETTPEVRSVGTAIKNLATMADSIFRDDGWRQRLRSGVRSAAATAGYDDEFKTYSDLRASLASMIAVAIQGSRPSDADVFRSAMPLVPDPSPFSSETRSSARRKIQTMIDMFEARLSPEAKKEIGFDELKILRPDDEEETSANPFRQGAGTQGAGANPFRNQ